MSSSSQKILVTGVAGFLGSHLADKLTEMKHKVIGVDNMLGGYKDNVPKNIDFYSLEPISFTPTKTAQITDNKKAIPVI